MTSSADPTPLTIAVLSAGISDPSSTRMLADRVAQRTLDILRDSGTEARVTVIELAPLAKEVAQSLVVGFPSDKVQDAIKRLATADALIAATPVYKAGISGIFKSFADLLDDDLLIATPVILAATGGTPRHAMVVDDQLRPLFAYLRAIPVPTSLYAAPEDWASPDLTARITRAATELALLLASNAPHQIATQTWHAHDHPFTTNAPIDFTTDLMRLATGGHQADS